MSCSLAGRRWDTDRNLTPLGFLAGFYQKEGSYFIRLSTEDLVVVLTMLIYRGLLPEYSRA